MGALDIIVRADGEIQPSLAETFRAWRLPHGSSQAYPLDITGATELDEVEAAMVVGLAHKDRVFVREYHAGRKAGKLHGYYVKQKARTYRRDPLTGLSEAYHPLEVERQFTLDADAFLPTAPFDALRDDAVGIDRTLVEQS